MSQWFSMFNPWDRVKIDGDVSLIGTVTAFSFRPSVDWDVTVGRNSVALVEVSYVHNGDIKTAWIEEHRLTKEE